MSGHLWDHDHSYYCQEGNYYIRGNQFHEVHSNYESWDDFLAEWPDESTDLDLNLVFRWDWHKNNAEDYEWEIEQDPEFKFPTDIVKIFIFHQRKARNSSIFIKVKPEDEDRVRAWLTPRAEHMRKLWEPLL